MSVAAGRSKNAPSTCCCHDQAIVVKIRSALAYIGCDVLGGRKQLKNGHSREQAIDSEGYCLPPLGSSIQSRPVADHVNRQGNHQKAGGAKT